METAVSPLLELWENGTKLGTRPYLWGMSVLHRGGEDPGLQLTQRAKRDCERERHVHALLCRWPPQTRARHSTCSWTAVARSTTQVL